MDIEAALPRLLTNYRRGVLVPFIGSGMSVPACASWGQLLRRMAERANHTISPELQQALDTGRAGSTELYRLADLCVRRLKSRGRQALANACREALGVARDSVIPEQTVALAQIRWPLVLSTNYDDLLLRAVHQRQATAAAEAAATGQGTGALPQLYEIAGQSVKDCHTVLRSLDVVTPPLLWSLQGYLGERMWTLTPIEEARAERLAREVVLGHQQYQSVINAQPHLRRAVAEVFRRRSLLFLGSGVQEDYLINLFSEIIHHHGNSAHTHFAVFHDRQRASVDATFFRLRLGIEPLFIHDYAEIPALLGRLGNNLSIHDQPAPRERVFSCAPYELAFRFPTGFTLRLRHEAVGCARGAGDCVGVSVGRSATGPILGAMATTVLQAAGIAPSAWDDWRPQDDDYVYRHATYPQLFAVAARAPRDGGDRRHLLVIPSALTSFLASVDREGFETATMGLLAAGRNRPWRALYPFVMMLSAIREFGRNPPARLRELVVSVLNPAVWYPLLAGKIPVELLLSADAATVWVHVVGEPDDELESYALTLTRSATVADVARECGLPPGTWKVSVYPVPDGDHQRVASWGDLAVVPGASVTFMAAGADSDSVFIHAG